MRPVAATGPAPTAPSVARLALAGATLAWLAVAADALLRPVADTADARLLTLLARAAEFGLLGACAWMAARSATGSGVAAKWTTGFERRRFAVVAAAALGTGAVVVTGAATATLAATAGQPAALLHWAAAGGALVLILAAAWAVRDGQAVGSAFDLVSTAATLYGIEIMVGIAAAADTAPWIVATHLLLGAAAWGCLVAAAARLAPAERALGPALGAALGLALDPAVPRSPATPRDARRLARALVALTKPRIIELLLVTTLPAMLLAARDTPGVTPLPFLLLAACTLVGGTMAAGSANALNQYLERDIDALMHRTQRRPLPDDQVRPRTALVFGLALGVVAFALLLLTVNLLAAVLTLIANAFYVVVYTALLKRRTTQNIVIGGAAGALPPMIGWAAVTGSLAPAAILLFIIVFFWTPPHFWALALRLKDDYAAAGVPMLPVVRGVPETTRQIGIYTVILVALTFALVPVGHMGLVYTVGAAAVGAAFGRQVVGLWRDGTTARAIRVYHASITYLSGLFVAVALDALLPLHP